jgi:hypothetical protein
VQAIVCRFVDTKTSVPSAQIASGRHALLARAGGGIEEAERLSAMWYFYAAIGPAIWALLNHLDKYLLGRFFRHGATGAALAVFTGFAGVLVACGILLFDLSRAAALEPRQALLVMAAGAFLVASYIPYLVALESAEARALVSIVTGLHPFFALVYGVILTRYFPAFGTESLKRRHVAHKALAMAIMWTGIAVTFS